jgi:hypothetical protein
MSQFMKTYTDGVDDGTLLRLIQLLMCADDGAFRWFLGFWASNFELTYSTAYDRPTSEWIDRQRVVPDVLLQERKSTVYGFFRAVLGRSLAHPFTYHTLCTLLYELGRQCRQKVQPHRHCSILDYEITVEVVCVSTEMVSNLYVKVRFDLKAFILRSHYIVHQITIDPHQATGANYL